MLPNQTDARFRVPPYNPLATRQHVQDATRAVRSIRDGRAAPAPDSLIHAAAKLQDAAVQVEQSLRTQRRVRMPAGATTADPRGKVFAKLATRPDVRWMPMLGNRHYAVSELGHVVRMLTGNLMSQRLSPDGYLISTITRDDNPRRQVSILVHRAVCQTFHGEQPEGHVAKILNGDRLNCRADNVGWRCRVDAGVAAYYTGKSMQRRVLSPDHALDIRAHRAAGMSIAELARQYECSQSSVEGVLRGTQWAWATDATVEAGTALIADDRVDYQ